MASRPAQQAGWGSIKAPGRRNKIARLGDVAHTPAIVACKLNGDGWQTSLVGYPVSPEVNRWSRDRVLAGAGAFRRLRGSASSAYWKGRVLQAYAAAAHWNWRQGQRVTGASRAAFGLLSLALAGPALLSPSYWQALRDEHVPHSPGRVLAGL